MTASFLQHPPGDWALLAALNQHPGLGAALAARMNLHPDRPAVLSARLAPDLPDTPDLSYRELAQRSGELAARLHALGGQPGDLLAIHLGRSVDMVVGMVAAVRLGMTYVPLDPGAAPQRNQRILKALQPRLGLARRPPALPEAEAVHWLAPEAAPTGAPLPAWHPGSWHERLYIMFTSGSTGLPKGVEVPARGIPAVVAGAMQVPMTAPAVWSQASSPAFDISNLEIWGALLSGGACLVQDAPRPDLADLGRFFSDPRLTHGQLTGSLFNALVEDAPQSFAGLRQMVVGGERASPGHMRSFLALHPHIRLLNSYGPTETTIYTQYHPVSLEDTLRPDGVPIGPVLPGSVARLEAPPGQAGGELWLGGDCLALGYFQDPEQTARRFVHKEGRRWYRSGDVMRHDPVSGRYIFLGRADRQVKVSGVRIELDEVELALSACDGVGEAAVFLHQPSGQPASLVAVYSARSAGQPPSAQALRSQLARSLPAAAVPGTLHPCAGTYSAPSLRALR